MQQFLSAAEGQRPRNYLSCCCSWIFCLIYALSTPTTLLPQNIIISYNHSTLSLFSIILSITPSIYLSLYLFKSIYLSLYQSLYLSITLSIIISIYHHIYPSIIISVYLFINSHHHAIPLFFPLSLTSPSLSLSPFHSSIFLLTIPCLFLTAADPGAGYGLVLIIFQP